MRNQSFIQHRRASSDNCHHQHQHSQEMETLDEQQEELIARVRQMIAYKDHQFNKTCKIRVQQWCGKLSSKPNNTVWRKNIIFYLRVLIEMINEGTITHPFCSVPCEGALPNLKLADLCYPIRRKMDEYERINHRRDVNGSTERVQNSKCKSIPIKKQYTLDLNDLEERTVKVNTTNKHQRKYSSNEQKTNWSAKNGNFKLINYEYKENDSTCINSNITRRLFQHQEKSSYQMNSHIYTQERQSNTIRSFIDLQKPSITAIGMQLLSKVFTLIKNTTNFQHNQQAQNLRETIGAIGKEIGIFLEEDQSILSESSTAFLKARENIRLKFNETDEETLEFMQFLHRMKAKNQ